MTTYKLRQASGLQSVYAWRLFEVLKSCESNGVYETLIEDFWIAMDAPPSCRKDFKALRIRVIEPAIEELKAKAGLQVEWQKLCNGSKRVSGLHFTFRPDPQGRLDIDSDSALVQEVVDTAVA